MPKYHAIATRDFTRVIRMGALVVGPDQQEIAPANEHVLPTKAGQIAQFPTRKARNAYIAACNAENPGAVAPYIFA